MGDAARQGGDGDGDDDAVGAVTLFPLPKRARRRLRHLQEIQACNVALHAVDVPPTEAGLYFTLAASTSPFSPSLATSVPRHRFEGDATEQSSRDEDSIHNSNSDPNTSPAGSVLYTSEVVAWTLSPAWCEIDSSALPQAALHAISCIEVRIWALRVGQESRYSVDCPQASEEITTPRRRRPDEGLIYLEPALCVAREVVDLESLACIGAALPRVHHSAPVNTLVFRLLDGYYAAPSIAHILAPNYLAAAAASVEHAEALDEDQKAVAVKAAQALQEGREDPGFEGRSAQLAHVRRRLGQARPLKQLSLQSFLDSVRSVRARRATIALQREINAELQRQLGAELEESDRCQRRLEQRERLAAHMQALEDTVLLAQEGLERLQSNIETARAALKPRIWRLTAAATALGAAQDRLQDADRSLAGRKGAGLLQSGLSQLRTRRARMLAQVHQLYPLEPSEPSASCSLQGDVYTNGGNDVHAPAVIQHYANGGSTHCHDGEWPALSIAGIHLALACGQLDGRWWEEEDHEAVATALGYIAHLVLLLAKYLDVPLKYPIVFAASRSLVKDPEPAAEAAAHAASAVSQAAALAGRPLHAAFVPKPPAA
eukprot:jgi/Chlat1/8037/Chrsp71S07513